MNRRGVEGEGSGGLIQSSTLTVACPVCREAPETVSIADGPAGIRSWPLPKCKPEALLLVIISSLDSIQQGVYFIFINTGLGKEICIHRLWGKHSIA